jgi:hypothetical protein
MFSLLRAALITVALLRTHVVTSFIATSAAIVDAIVHRHRRRYVRLWPTRAAIERYLRERKTLPRHASAITTAYRRLTHRYHSAAQTNVAAIARRRHRDDCLYVLLGTPLRAATTATAICATLTSEAPHCRHPIPVAAALSVVAAHCHKPSLQRTPPRPGVAIVATARLSRRNPP